MENNEKNDIIKMVAEAYKNPEKGTEDINGNTKLAVLQSKFSLSSLKVQKILITAGVYEPVHKNTNYEKVTALYEQNKSIDEISEILGISKAAVCAYLPYENGVYNADEHGGSITPNAVRKRRQRAKADDIRFASRNMLLSGLTDEGFWETLKKHQTEVFYSLKRKRFTIDPNKDAILEIHIKQPHKDDISRIISKDEVIAVLHEAIDLKTKVQNKRVEEYEKRRAENADDTKKLLFDKNIHVPPEAFRETEDLEFLYPLMVYFGIIGGDVHEFAAKRTIPDMRVCSCCGKNRGRIYPAGTYMDLDRACYNVVVQKHELGVPLNEDEQEELDTHGTKYHILYGERSDIIKEFDNSNSDRYLCVFCMRPVRNALFNRNAHFGSRSDYADFSGGELRVQFEKEPVIIESPAMDAAGRKLPAGSRVLRIHGAHGIVHYFAFTVTSEKDHDNNITLTATGTEVHLLTLAGKYTADSSGTDIVLKRSRYIADCSVQNIEKNTYIVQLELLEKLRAAVERASLKECEYGADNSLAKGKSSYQLMPSGTIVPVPARDEITGDIIGSSFKIDGIGFTGEETAKLFEQFRGKYVCYTCSDEPLAAGEYLKKEKISHESLLHDIRVLISMFCNNGKFLSVSDEYNFQYFFGDIVKKLRLYNKLVPGGYAKLAAMNIITELIKVNKSERFVKQIQDLIVSEL